MEKYLALKEETMNKIYQYLLSKPMGEVRQLVVEIEANMKAVDMDEKASEDKEG